MANQFLANQPKLTLEQSIGRYFSNEKLSDVCFLVGEQREKFYAHRFLLAIESEAFEAMFYGSLKETKYEIPVPEDSPVGFRNMLKYFYTKKVEFDLSEIYETYKTADKYGAMNLVQDLSDHIAEKCLEVPSACVIYDQLRKLAAITEKSQISESLIDDVKLLISAGFLEASASASFDEISENTLIAILNFNMLNAAELDLLKICIKWTNHEVLRQKLGSNQANKQKIFEPIKRLIRFGDLSVDDFRSIPELDDYLSLEEIAKIFLYLSHKRVPLPIDCQSPRVPAKARVAQSTFSENVTISYGTRHTVELAVKFAKRICIVSIETFANTSGSGYTSLEFEICEDKKDLPSGSKIVQQNGCKPWMIDFSKCIRIFEANTEYILKFTYMCSSNEYNYNYNNNNRRSFGASRDLTLKSDEGEVVVQIRSTLGYQCIKSLGYWSV